MPKHAYLLLVHGDVAVFESLLRLVDHPKNDIYVHVDAKTSMKSFAMAAERTLLASPIRFVSSRTDVRWGAFGMVEAELSLLREAVEEKAGYVYLHMLSGADLPLRKQIDIHRFFEDADQREFIDFWPAAKRDLEKFQDRYRFYDVYAPRGRGIAGKASYHVTRRVAIGLQKIAHVDRLKGAGFHLKMGSQYASITEAFANELCSRQAWIESHFGSTLVPDEAVLQTIAFNSDFRDRVYSYAGVGTPHTTMRAINFCDEGSLIWQKEDVAGLLDSGSLFARKFSSTIGPGAAQELERLLLGR